MGYEKNGKKIPKNIKDLKKASGGALYNPIANYVTKFITFLIEKDAFKTYEFPTQAIGDFIKSRMQSNK